VVGFTAIAIIAMRLLDESRESMANPAQQASHARPRWRLAAGLHRAELEPVDTDDYHAESF
jgi:hypothetical protein